MKILKVGGSFITRKSGYMEVDPPHLAIVAKAIAAIWRKGVRDFVLVHGAGSFGHALVLKYGLNEGIHTEVQKKRYKETQEACARLSAMVVEALAKEGVPAKTIPPALVIEQENRRISRFDTMKVDELMKKGILPVLHGDMVPDKVLGGSVCSGDQIAAYLGKDSEFMVLATNVDGVLDDKGNVIEKITNANFSEIARHLKKSDKDVTGAMEGKLRELLALDTVSYIVNAAHPERIEALMLGKKAVCTEVRKK